MTFYCDHKIKGSRDPLSGFTLTLAMKVHKPTRLSIESADGLIVDTSGAG